MPSKILLMSASDSQLRQQWGISWQGLLSRNVLFVFSNAALLAGMLALNWRFLLRFKQVSWRPLLPATLLALPLCYLVIAESRQLRREAHAHLKALKDAA